MQVLWGLGGFIGYAATPRSSADWGLDSAFGMLAGITVGGGVGLATAIVVDDAVLSNERVRRDAPPDLRPTFEPRLGATRGGATVGVGGTF